MICKTGYRTGSINGLTGVIVLQKGRAHFNFLIPKLGNNDYEDIFQKLIRYFNSVTL